MGFFDRDQTDLSIPLFNPQADAVALQSAEEGAVLLKNDGNLLPLDRKRIHSIAVFGPGAYPAHVGGGGSSQVTAFAPVSILAGLSSALAPTSRSTGISASRVRRASSPAPPGAPIRSAKAIAWRVTSICKRTTRKSSPALTTILPTGPRKSRHRRPHPAPRRVDRLLHPARPTSTTSWPRHHLRH